MQISCPEKRLHQFWGSVDQKHIKIIQQFLCGTKVLDMGCGYGTTTAQITDSGYSCIGIDYDMDLIQKTSARFPGSDFKFANAEELPFDDESFDVIILRDALHHFYGEAAFTKVKAEILRVAKKNSRLIFFDPNINFMLRTFRTLASHKDEECDFETAVSIMQQLQYKIIHSSFNTVFSLPLSGGYVGINFVPDIDFIKSFIMCSENSVERAINKLGMGRHFCWRYIVVGEK